MFRIIVSILKVFYEHSCISFLNKSLLRTKVMRFTLLQIEKKMTRCFLNYLISIFIATQTGLKHTSTLFSSFIIFNLSCSLANASTASAKSISNCFNI